MIDEAAAVRFWARMAQSGGSYGCWYYVEHGYGGKGMYCSQYIASTVRLISSTITRPTTCKMKQTSNNGYTARKSR